MAKSSCYFSYIWHVKEEWSVLSKYVNLTESEIGMA